MKVLIVPEDPTHDQFILKPVVERIFRDLQISARVDVLRDPHLRGVDQALVRQTLAEIVADNHMIDLFLVMVDRDCNRFNNRQRAREREVEHHEVLIACLAVEEVEVWMLALHRDRLGATWRAVRSDCDPKERYADTLLDQIGRSGPGAGRKKAMRSLTGDSWTGLLGLCPEIAGLKQQIAAWSEETRMTS